MSPASRVLHRSLTQHAMPNRFIYLSHADPPTVYLEIVLQTPEVKDIGQIIVVPGKAQTKASEDRQDIAVRACCVCPKLWSCLILLHRQPGSFMTGTDLLSVITDAR